MDPGYFDSSIFLAIFNGDSVGPQIKALLREMRQERDRVHTSIITIQEVSVLSFDASTSLSSKDKEQVLGDDNYAKVHRLARIHGITKDIALLAARIEALVLARTKTQTRDQRHAFSPRRKWDCFHIATAIETNCRCLYTLDQGRPYLQPTGNRHEQQAVAVSAATHS